MSQPKTFNFELLDAMHLKIMLNINRGHINFTPLVTKIQRKNIVVSFTPLNSNK